MQLIDLALHIPNFLPEDFCDDMINFYESKPCDEKYFEQSYNQEKDKNVQSSGLCLEIMSEDSVYQNIHDYTGKIIVKWIEHINSFGCFDPLTLMSLSESSYKYRMIKYSDGLNIHTHTDVGTAKLEYMLIRGSCTLNFSSQEDYDGGEFVLWRGANQVKMGKGDIMIFPADAFWTHHTNPVYGGARYAVNSFLLPKYDHLLKK